MSIIKLHGNSSSNSYNFSNDADVPYEVSSPDSLCSTYIDDFGLGPYELQESRNKMSDGESPSSVLPKKKKKNDGKGQSQLNKCLNEKRRREQENIYIEELAELISASFADMNSLSVKPDKCAILQETVKQVRVGNHRISSEQSDNLISTECAVQQGEVSSTKPTRIKRTELAPLLLSALDGFLFAINSNGQIQFLTKNIYQFLFYKKEELIGKSIYNFVHHSDHTKFSVILNPLLIQHCSSIVSPGSNQPTSPPMEQSPSGSKGNSWNQRFTTKFNCRFLIKPPSDQDQSIEDKQTRVCQYETLEVSSTKVNGMVDDENIIDGSSQNLLCIARRIPFNDKHLSAPLEQFTIKLDQNGEILALDTKDVSEIYSDYINQECLEGIFLHDKCHKNDVHKVISHIQETKQMGYSTSSIYKLHLVDEKYINVRTKSKYFKSNDTQDMGFIMAALSIIGDSEMCAMIESNTIANRTIAEQDGTESLSLMTSSIPSNQSVSSLQSEAKFSNSDYNTTTTTDLNFSDFELFPSTTFGDMIPDNKWSDNSNNTVEKTTTPLNSPPVSSNPITPASQVQYSSYPLSPLIQSPKESFDSRGNIERITESARLRTLLMTSKRLEGSTADEDKDSSKNKHNILKGLLNPDEIPFQNSNDESIITHQNVPQSPNIRQASHSSFDLTDTPSTLNNASNNNNMLLKLLNDKSQDEEDLKSHIGLKKQNELLQQLLNKDDNIRQCDYFEQTDSSNEDLILKSMGFRILSPTSPDSRNNCGRKRNSISADDESEHPPLKRTGLGNSVLESLPNVDGSSTNVNSKLRERNKMLASLLAKDTPPTSIPAIPASVISATPQDKLVTIIKQQSGASWNSTNLSQNMQNQRAALLQKSGNNLYLNHMLDEPQVIPSQSQIQQMRQVTTSNSGYSTQLNNISEQNSNPLPFNSDPELSELLEEVMDIMNVSSDNSTLLNLFHVIESTNSSNSVGLSTNQNTFNTMNEKMAVNAIQKSLMQVESTVKTPSSQVNYGVSSGNNNIHITNTQNQFIQPPAYPQQKTAVKFNLQPSPRLAGVPPYTKNVQRPPLQQQQSLLQHQHKQKLIHQQQQKHRLLQQQQQQQIMVVTTNTGGVPDPLKNIDSLLNNTGPPNVALQRSPNVPDSQNQLNSVYATSGSQLLNSQISQSSNRQPIYSSLSQSFPMLNYGITTQTRTTSPQQIVKQQSTSSTQHMLHHSPINSCQQQQTQNIYINQTQQPIVWTQPRLTLHQQQNPMLNAQLQVSGFNNNSVRQNFISQQPQGHLGAKRVISSPLGYNSEVTPNTNCQTQQQQQQFRLSRNINLSSNPGGNGVTEFTRNELRAFVGVRSQQGGNTQNSSHLLPGQNVTPTELIPLGLNIDMSPTDGESPKWSGINSDLCLSPTQTQGIPTRNPNDDSSRTNSTNSSGITDQKSSLLQKLLSE